MERDAAVYLTVLYKSAGIAKTVPHHNSVGSPGDKASGLDGC